MPTSISKPQMVSAVSGLPEDATVEDAMERLLFLSKVDQGLEHARRGETVPHDAVVREMEARMARWKGQP